MMDASRVRCKVVVTFKSFQVRPVSHGSHLDQYFDTLQWVTVGGPADRVHVTVGYSGTVELFLAGCSGSVDQLPT